MKRTRASEWPRACRKSKVCGQGVGRVWAVCQARDKRRRFRYPGYYGRSNVPLSSVRLLVSTVLSWSVIVPGDTGAAMARKFVLNPCISEK